MAMQREMLVLGEAGYKEVTLLGQNIDAYGRDLPGAAADGSGRRAWTFTDLLHHVHDVPGIERIRFATSHPRSAALTWQPSLHAVYPNATSRVLWELCGTARLPSPEREGSASPLSFQGFWRRPSQDHSMLAGMKNFGD